MAPASASPRHTPTANGRRRGRPPGTTNAARAARQAALEAAMASEPPPKKRRYIPGGPGGGGRFVDADSDDATPTARAATASRPRAPRSGATPSALPRRERSARTRSFAAADAEDPQWGSAAAVAASVKQAEDYKPREERGWEEFHPNLDIEGTFMVLPADEVDGVLPQEIPNTPIAQTPGTPLLGSTTPSRQAMPASAGNTPLMQGQAEINPFETSLATPTRRPRRLTRDIVSFHGARDAVGTPKTPKILPIQNQTPKERLDLKLPSYRKTNRIELFESKTFGQARYVDRAMSNVGYQESDSYPRPERNLIKATEGNIDDEPVAVDSSSADDGNHATRLLRVEYDMDEQDDMWLEHYNAQRKQNELEAITREVFEITMTGIEKEWHALEKRIPKPNPKPPQTHRPRSSSAAAVNGESREGEEPDSKCAICDDGDCENTNAIVFCDGCNLAVHQECYGVPFIPEGQWMCRKCQLCGRGVPTCIFCPNTDGAFKQTNSSKWAHLLCAMWIPEVSLGNHTFMEPVMDVEKVPKTRWKLSCYICHQKMGACIQCSNKNCYQAFHVTCARRAKLYLRMKTSHGALAVLDGSMVLKAFCDRHCPLEYATENNVHQATRTAKKFYKRNMRGRIWADNHAMANVLAARHRNATTEHPPDESQLTGAKNAAVVGENKKGQPPKNVWKLPSGAPVIPQQVFEVVEASIQRFSFRKRKDYLSEACRYWTLKREARRGAALLKRLQLQMESFSSMELTRRNFAAMGPGGKARLARRLDFAEILIKDLEQLKTLSEELVQREVIKLDAAELEQGFVDECYFPVAKVLGPAMDKAIFLDKDVFSKDLIKIQAQMEQRYHVTGLSFAQDLGDAVSRGIAAPFQPTSQAGDGVEVMDVSPVKGSFADIRERRKLGKRILKAVQPYIETALQIEAEISNRSLEALHAELESIIETSVEAKQTASAGNANGGLADVEMVDAGEANQEADEDAAQQTDPEAMKVDEPNDAPDAEGEPAAENEATVTESEVGGQNIKRELTAAESTTSLITAVGASQTPPGTNGSFTSVRRPSQAGPPTPPQSNGSLGKISTDPLSEGGILWHMQAFEPKGTSILAEQWAGRDAIRMLSEDLTDMDDDELKGLGVDVDIPDAILTPADVDDNSGTATPMATVKSKVNKLAMESTTANTKRRTSARRR